MFVVLADRRFAAKKISASVADNAKYQFVEFLKVAETQENSQQGMILTKMFGLFARQYLSFHMGKVLQKEDFL